MNSEEWVMDNVEVALLYSIQFNKDCQARHL